MVAVVSSQFGTTVATTKVCEVSARCPILSLSNFLPLQPPLVLAFNTTHIPVFPRNLEPHYINSHTRAEHVVAAIAWSGSSSKPSTPEAFEIQLRTTVLIPMTYVLA